MTFGLFFPKYFQNIFFRTCFINFGFINLEINKNVFQNDFLSSGSIPEIPKTVKGNFGILEECMGAGGRKM